MNRQTLLLVAAAISAAAIVSSALIVIGPFEMGSVETAALVSPQASLPPDDVSSQPADDSADSHARAVPQSHRSAVASPEITGSISPQRSQPAPATVADTAQGTGDAARVTGADAELRSQPNVAAPMIVAYPIGRQLRVVARQGNFARVVDPQTSQAGWIDAKQIGSERLWKTQRTASAGRERWTREADADSNDDDAGIPGGMTDWSANVEAAHPQRVIRRQGPVAGLFRALGGY